MSNRKELLLPIMKSRIIKETDELPLMEDFFSIQGEGYFSGQAAYFLRIGGCDVGCNWCDVKESWNQDIHPLTSINDILKRIGQYPVSTVVVTGGEPLMWDMEPLTRKLIKNDYKVHLETSGSHPLTGNFDWICWSPKKFKNSRDEIRNFANELKIIVQNKHDLLWGEKYSEIVSEHCKLFLQPEWSRREEMIPLIIDYVQNHPKWSISLQSHKYMKIP
jgi:7-carboxy-7-deazaguanine synthase